MSEEDGGVTVGGIPLTFTVGSCDSPDAAAKVVLGLKKLVERGEHAARALRALEERGYYEAPAPYLEQSVGGEWTVLRTAKLLKKLPADPSELPDLSAWELKAVSASEDKFCGHRVVVVSFTVSVPCIVQSEPDRAVYRHDRAAVPAAMVRIGKKAVTVCAGGNETPAAKPDPGAWAKMVGSVSTAVSGVAVQVGSYKNGTRLGEHAKTVELRRMARRQFRALHAEEVLRQAVRDAHAAAVILS